VQESGGPELGSTQVASITLVKTPSSEDIPAKYRDRSLEIVTTHSVITIFFFFAFAYELLRRASSWPPGPRRNFLSGRRYLLGLYLRMYAFCVHSLLCRYWNKLEAYSVTTRTSIRTRRKARKPTASSCTSCRLLTTTVAVVHVDRCDQFAAGALGQWLENRSQLGGSGSSFREIPVCSLSLSGVLCVVRCVGILCMFHSCYPRLRLFFFVDHHRRLPPQVSSVERKRMSSFHSCTFGQLEPLSEHVSDPWKITEVCSNTAVRCSFSFRVM
jgi:hypothetical protein